MTTSRTVTADAVDRRHDATRSVVLRYHRAVQLAREGRCDGRFSELLERTSIREGMRTLPLFEHHGVEIHILDMTSLMHTSTIKSIDGCVTVARCLERGDSRIVVETGGNTGTALAEYATRVGIETFCFAPEENIGLLDSRIFSADGAHLIAVSDPRQVRPAARQFAAETGTSRVPEVEWRYQSSMTIGFFVAEQLLDGAKFDWVAQAISAGFGPIGVYRALAAHGEEIDAHPRFLGVQQQPNCPVYRAWRRATRDLDASPVESTEGLLVRVMYDGSPGIYGTYPVLRETIARSRGDIMVVDGSEFERYLRRTRALDRLRELGIEVTVRDGEVLDKAGPLALAGVLKRIERGEIAEGERVLCFLTSGAGRPDGEAEAEHRIEGAGDAIHRLVAGTR